MYLQLHGKTAFISGATSGIGLATAKVLLQEGVNVIINGREPGRLEKALTALKKMAMADQWAKGILADLSTAQATEDLLAELPVCDILINNLGIYRSASFFETTDEDWQNMMEVNLMCGVRLARKLLPGMLERNWGRIIFISSECATLVPEDLIAYSTTKAAVEVVSKGLAQLCKGTGVTVNAAAPGSTLTEGAEKFLANLAEKEGKTVEEAERAFFKENRASSLLQRFASVKDVANTIAYYASPLSSATNGAVIRIDGGSMG